MNKLIKRAKKIRNWGISGIVIVPIFVILSIILIYSVGGTTADSTDISTTTIMLALVLIILLIISIVAGIGCFVSSILILTTDWKNQELNNNKTVWGILGIIILPALAPLIFGSMAVKRLQIEGDSGISSVDSNNIPPSSPYKTDDQW